MLQTLLLPALLLVAQAGNIVMQGAGSSLVFYEDGANQVAKLSANELRLYGDEARIVFQKSDGNEVIFDVQQVQALSEGTINNPVSDPMDLRAELSGWYYLDVPGFEKKQVYVDNDRNGGAWVLAAVVRQSSCQAHWNTGDVGLVAGKGPSKDSASTQKLSDAWMNALRAQSSYSGTTGLWMEATTWNKHNFISSAATINSVDSAENQDARTHIATIYEGGLSNRDPNSGTRGLGDHHTNAAYFSYQRHPEQGNNCGFKNDLLGESDGYLWIK